MRSAVCLSEVARERYPRCRFPRYQVCREDGARAIAGPIYLLAFLFGGGLLLSPPYPATGQDPTEDDLACER